MQKTSSFKFSSDDYRALLRLIRTPRIGPIACRNLLSRYVSPQEALKAVPTLARRGGGNAPPLASEKAIESEIAKVKTLGGRYIFQGSPYYPPLLAQLDNAPPVLIVKGNPKLLQKPAIAMVGARNASAAAMRFAHDLSHQLTEKGYLVISGLARGIDTAAHQGAGTKKTIAVIAGGIDSIYPPENADLQQKISEQGLLVSEMPPATEPKARHFPARNRIIAGIALGVVVAEASPKSGSLITAKLATNIGREVMAIPGFPMDSRSHGCNQLIREGATLIQSSDDIIEAVALLSEVYQTSPTEKEQFSSSDHLHSNPIAYKPPAILCDIREKDRKTIQSLIGSAPIIVDELIRQSGLESAIIQTVLLELELAGRLERHAGGRISLILG
ncbi:MAG: DNA-processing protein DprA [Zymomonas mobilis subsp. pomaceae]|uniref:DNA protecting protein DprA n=1 Tax=Zymomonas mobilis subsp. pomaceae (strain ATCC 29192 / DSM 22645 / JCM 10191 / CCUG 17912 / NBRC 13757 / NCIMB 11200 / NRRL B-4491 / Barker I) TaxID=579138 RepID=F8ETK1_ZYMMT|nr:DNA-processing protein DprA [Zymomonas mobilis]AEI37011.1 DNA protecting protein DprA [Zymomonas mobilis subsp. pomaceae ATCC 29192]MDX5948383.1 DNA-processing protein DprA [Zymomonas mobilis subsp. pomaceae]GEB89627.1 DNA processing protein DprA [Zymomonas mobilis subsp. pomaceae]